MSAVGLRSYTACNLTRLVSERRGTVVRGVHSMKTTQIAQYAHRLTYAQPRSKDKMMSRSAYALAAIGLGLSTFSVRQMVLTQSRRF